jgi:antitoxin component YwqK of YwqJK toxin-antitoxin module
MNRYCKVFNIGLFLFLMNACTSQQPTPELHSTLKRDFTAPVKNWKNGVIHTKDGHIITRTEDERSYRVTSYKNGQKDGISALYPKEPYKQLFETRYVNGVKEGLCRKYNVDTPYVRDKKEGIEREYNDRFMIRATPFHNDKKDGSEVKYDYTSGELSMVNFYSKGKKKRSTAYTNGKITNITEFDGDIYHGNSKTWSKDGHILLEVMPYRFGVAHGMQKVYYPNGTIKYEVPYRNGKKNGVLKAYYPNAKLHYKITYKNDLPDEVGYVYNKSGKRERIDYDTLMVFAQKIPQPVERWRQ